MSDRAKIEFEKKEAVISDLTLKLNKWIADKWGALFHPEFYEQLNKLFIERLKVKAESKQEIIKSCGELVSDVTGGLANCSMAASPAAGAAINLGGKVIANILKLSGFIIKYQSNLALNAEQVKQLRDKLDSIKILELIKQYYEETTGKSLEIDDPTKIRVKLQQIAEELAVKVSALLYYRHVYLFENEAFKASAYPEFIDFLIKSISCKLVKYYDMPETVISKFLKSAFPETPEDDLFRCADREGTPFDSSKKRKVFGFIPIKQNPYFDAIEIEDQSGMRCYYYFIEIFYKTDRICIPSDPMLSEFLHCTSSLLPKTYSASAQLYPYIIDFDVDLMNKFVERLPLSAAFTRAKLELQQADKMFLREIQSQISAILKTDVSVSIKCSSESVMPQTQIVEPAAAPSVTMPKQDVVAEIKSDGKVKEDISTTQVSQYQQLGMLIAFAREKEKKAREKLAAKEEALRQAKQEREILEDQAKKAGIKF